jgi:hypothetical protein
MSAIKSYATLQAEMIDLFTAVADDMDELNDKRAALIMRKMAATVETIPYDMLAEFGHNYDPVLISCAVLQQIWHIDAADYANAHDLVLTMLDWLRSIDLDHPITRKAIEMIETILESAGRTKR